MLAAIRVLAPASVAAISLISVNDEIAIGREAQRQIRTQVPPVTDQRITSYVSALGRRLAARAPGPRYPYSFSVADFRELNAFALPGGPVWINRGILHAAANESQLAGVIAHEVAHVALRHAAGQMTTRLVANGLLGLLGAILGNDPGGARTARAGAQLLAGGYMLTFSRDDEREADAAGVDILGKAGWHPSGFADFLEMLARAQGRNAHSVAAFLSSHPAPAERAKDVRRRIGPRPSGRRDSAAFRAARARARQLPPARPMK